MARKRPFEKYPKEYLKMFSIASKKTVSVPCANRTQADSLRNELYTCRQVIYDEGPKELAREAQNVRFYIKKQADDCWLLIAEPIFTRT